MKALTPRQEEILTFIKTYIRNHTYPPTIREVAASFEFSSKSAFDHIKALEKKGRLRCTANHSRAIELLEEQPRKDREVLDIPILGHVAAGVPIFSEENPNGTLALPADMFQTGSHFILEVRGDSMTGAGILDGDLAIFRWQQTAQSGQLIVAMVDEAYTLKRFYRETNRIRLQAENEAYPPIYTQNIQIIGKLITLIRNYQ